MAQSNDDLPFDLSLLEGELQQEEAPDPLDLIDDCDQIEAVPEELLQEALRQLQGSQEEQLQGLKVFCEHRDPRSQPLLRPLLGSSCPILRMSAVYALGRNPDPQALPELQQLFRLDSNCFVRKALAWTLGNYPEAEVVPDLLNALRLDNAAVRLWAAGSLADAALAQPQQLDTVTRELLLALQVDGQAEVRSNCAWGLGRLHPVVAPEAQEELVHGLLQTLLNDNDFGVRQDARSALEQLGDGEVLAKLQALVEDGLIA